MISAPSTTRRGPHPILLWLLSSIGKKTIVALTGICLVLFVTGHLLGNFTIYLGPDWLNALVILFTWNGFKMLRIDPVTLVLRRYIRVTRPDRRASTDVHREEARAQYEVETMGATR